MNLLNISTYHIIHGNRAAYYSQEQIIYTNKVMLGAFIVLNIIWLISIVIMLYKYHFINKKANEWIREDSFMNYATNSMIFGSFSFFMCGAWCIVILIALGAFVSSLIF